MVQYNFEDTDGTDRHDYTTDNYATPQSEFTKNITTIRVKPKTRYFRILLWEKGIAGPECNAAVDVRFDFCRVINRIAIKSGIWFFIGGFLLAWLIL